MRSIGTRLVALAILGVSLYALHGAWLQHRGRRGESLVTAALILGALGLVAAEAIWSLRGHAFLTYAIWAVAAIIAVTMNRLATPAGAHAVRLVPQVLYLGLALGGVALYLRRAV